MSQVVTASEEAPYLAFFLKLNIATVRDILNTEEVHVPESPIGTRGMAIGEATIELVRSCSRMMDILDAPQDIPFLGKLIHREIIYRLLQRTQGARLRAIATLGDQSHRTEKAVAWLRENYEKPLRVEQLATIAGMGRSTLHHHFRALTAMSPLQFQKQLRLRAARQRMLVDGSQGLLLTGPSGVGKSRLMWLLLRGLLDDEHRTAAFLNAVRFRTGLQTAARDGTTEEFVRRLVRTDVLFWDDLGQMHLTGAASEMLLHLVEERVCTGRPILVTTQYVGKRMDAQFERPEMGQAIRRRLNEFCRVVTVRQAREQRDAAPFQAAVRR